MRLALKPTPIRLLIKLHHFLMERNLLTLVFKD